MYVDMITLQDLIKYQDISYKIIDGFYFVGAKDFRIRHVISELYNMRLEYKKTKNPLQEVIKLIMNSSYGKTIQKPIETETEGILKKDMEEYILTHSYNLLSIDDFDNSLLNKQWINEETGNFEEIPNKKFLDSVMVRKYKSTLDQFNNCIAGVMVLSMSKRIMNEVMCLAEDLDIKIYYQDTDSMHIEHDKIPLLAEKYKEKYGRELIGKNMGQFHNDFDELADGFSTELIILGKKMYIDRLSDEQNNSAVHYRMKGIPQDVVKLYAQMENPDETNEIEQLIKLYEKIHDGKVMKMNICATRDMFDMKLTGEITSKQMFEREIKNTATGEI